MNRHLPGLASQIHDVESIADLLLVVRSQISRADRDGFNVQSGSIKRHENSQGVVVARIGIDNDAFNSRSSGWGRRTRERLRPREFGGEQGESAADGSAKQLASGDFDFGFHREQR